MSKKRTNTAYELTRRRGKPGTIRRLTGASTDDDALTRTDVYTDTEVQKMYKGPTKYSAVLFATASRQDIGDTSFTVYLPDVGLDFRVQREDRVVYGGTTYEVISSSVFGDEQALTFTGKAFHV